MRNREVGFLLVGISAMMGFIIYSFNNALSQIIASSCTHGESCPMWGTIDFQTNVSAALMAMVAVVGLYLIFFSREESLKVTRVREPVPVEIDGKGLMDAVSGLGSEHATVMESIIKSGGSIFQSELTERTGLSKVKVTRILDKLEGRGLIERKRRGMTNVVILKH